MEASFYSENRDACLRTLGDHWGAKLNCGLCNSTDYASRILWPGHLVGEPMFEFTKAQRSQGMLQRVVHFFLPATAQTLSSVALAELSNARDSSK